MERDGSMTPCCQVHPSIKVAIAEELFSVELKQNPFFNIVFYLDSELEALESCSTSKVPVASSSGANLSCF